MPLLRRDLPSASVHAALDAVERLQSADPSLVAIEAHRSANVRRNDGVVERPVLRRFDPPALHLPTVRQPAAALAEAAPRDRAHPSRLPRRLRYSWEAASPPRDG